MYHYYHTDFSLFNSNRWSVFIKYFAKKLGISASIWKGATDTIRTGTIRNDVLESSISVFYQMIPWMDGNRSLAFKRRITFVTSVLFFEKNAKIVTNLWGVQYHLKLSFLQGIYGLWQKEKFHQKNEGVRIRRSRPVPLKVV